MRNLSVGNFHENFVRVRVDFCFVYERCVCLSYFDQLYVMNLIIFVLSDMQYFKNNKNSILK